MARSVGVGFAFVVAVVLAVPSAIAGRSPGSVLLDKIGEAMRLEAHAFNLYEDDPENAEVEELVNRSIELLNESLPLVRDKELRSNLATAVTKDRLFLAKRAVPKEARFELGQGIMFKWDALELLEPFALRERARDSKRSQSTRVSAPACRFLATAAPPISGCSKTDFWDIYASATASKARCVFIGPAGALGPTRVLFPGTLQFPSCEVRGFKLVDGVRKRVIRAELKIVVPRGITARGTKQVVIQASWK